MYVSLQIQAWLNNLETQVVHVEFAAHCPFLGIVI